MNDDELDALLVKWQAPVVPGRLRSAVFPRRRWWAGTIPVPVPVVALLVALVVALVFAWHSAAAHIENQAQSRQFQFHSADLQPVSELRPVIIRGKNARN